MIDTSTSSTNSTWRMAYLAAAFVLAWMGAAAVMTATARADTRELDVTANQATFVELFYVYDPANCRVGRMPEADLIQPKGGVLFLQLVPTTITKGYCRGKSVRAAGIFYRSLPGFRGRDVGRVRFRYSSFDDSLINRRTKTYRIIATVR